MIKRIVEISFLIFLFFSIIAPVARTAEQTVFGPKDLEIGRWHLHLSRYSFSAENPGDGYITISKNTPQDTINAGFVFFNGHFISIRHFFAEDDIVLYKDVTLKSLNYLSVFLEGSRGASINITISNVYNPIPPTIEIDADPQAILQGESTILAWSSEHADSCVIEPDIGSVDMNGSMVVAPKESTVYTITATGSGGTITKDVLVTVLHLPSVELSVNPDSILQTESAMLSWTTTHAESVEINQGIGMVPVNGSLSISPTETITYTLIATGPGGSISVQETLSVINIPQIGLVVSETEIEYGESVTLTWSAEGYDTVFIKDSAIVSEELPSGSRVVTPAYTTTYSLSATNADGPIFLSAVVKVHGHLPEPQPEGSFGKQYEDLVPQDASLVSYDMDRFIVVTGLVTDIAGTPLADVTTEILNHPEYGTAATDETGRFSIPAEGGDVLTIVYQKENYLSGQRKVNTGHNDIVISETIAMIESDPLSTTITFDDNPSTVVAHQSTQVTDAFGSRSCTTVFTGDNAAYEMDLVGNVVRELTTITTRTTEYTTPESMPAKLPPSSAFTYCIELSVDGVKNIQFEKPVVTWVDNFLGFEVGEIVPVGYYDKNQGVWVPSDNGVVVKLLDTDANGIVDALDADGDDQPDDLDDDGVYADEVVGLEDNQKYSPASTFWRTEFTHFSTADKNFPVGTPSTATLPNSLFSPESDQDLANNDACYGSYTASFVEERGRIVHEDIPISGTDMTLHYASSRVEGYNTVITIPASGETIPDVLKRIDVTLTIAGRILKQELPPEPDQMAEFYWDGLDYLGRSLQTPIPAHVSVGFVYDATYYSAGDFDQAFGQPGIDATTVPARQEIILTKNNDLMIHPSGSKDSKDFAEGWTISRYHHMNLQDASTLHKGDGTSVFNNIRTIETFAGTGFLYPLGFPNKLAVDSGGNVYVALDFYGVIYRIDTNGVINNLTGLYQGWGFSGDGGPAVEARIEGCGGIAVDSNRNIYFSDIGNACIRKIDANGIINTIAGIPGSRGYSGDGGPASQALLNLPKGIAVDDIGNIYFADNANDCIRKIDPNGMITTFAGGNGTGYDGDGGLAINAQITRPDGVAVDHIGNIYFTDFTTYGHHVIRRVDTSGIITTFAGTSRRGWSGDGGPATEAQLFSPLDVAVDNIGNIYIADDNNSRIRMVNTSGIITTVAGSGIYDMDTATGPATLAKLRHPMGIAVDDDGNIYIADNANHLVKKISFPSSFTDTILTGGNAFSEETLQGHAISTAGLHTKTVDLHTGNTQQAFGHDENGRLVSVFDRFGNETVISRDENGVPLSIMSPDGLTTTFEIDENNYLTRITYPDGTSYDFEYDPKGLMTSKIEPEGNRFQHQFDANGRLFLVTDEEGGNWTYTKDRYANGDSLVQVTTAEGNITSYRDVTESTGAYTSTITKPTGAETFFSRSNDGLRVTKSLSCGMTLSFQKDLDPEYRYEFIREMIETTPSGLEKITTREKIYHPDYSTDGVLSITETMDVNGNVTTLEDDLESIKSVESPEGRTATIEYDPGEQLISSLSIPGLQETIFDYDDRGRLVSIVSGSREIDYRYTPNGFLESITDAENHTTSYAYDDVGRATQIDRSDSSSVWFSYDGNGNISMFTNPNAIVHGFGYNKVNLYDVFQTPLSGGYRFEYDRDRQLTQINFPSGNQIMNIYDATRLLQTQTPEGNISYTYVCGDKLTSIANGTDSITYEYDGKLLTSESMSGILNQSLYYDYNDDFFVTALTYAGETTEYTYDNDGLLTGAGNFTITRNVDNGLPESVRSPTLNLHRTFNGFGEANSETSTVDNFAICSWSLDRDNNGRITQKIESVAGTSSDYEYTYDAMGRLLTVIKDSVLVAEYQYNTNGSRLYEMNSLRGFANRSFSYSDEDHLLTAGHTTYQYDLDGFLTSKIDGTNITQYNYSSRGELLSVTMPDSTLIEYVHDPSGRRIAKKINGIITEKYLWQGLTRLLATYDGNDNLLMRFEYADGRMPIAMTKAGIRYYLSYDQVGSMRAVADGSGNVVKQISYDSFGYIVSDSDSTFQVPFGFAGGLHDRDTNLVKFGYRDYDPDTGRWTAKDPILFEGGDTDLYGYVLSDPVGLIDPLGLINWSTVYKGALSTFGGGVVVVGGALAATTGVGSIGGLSAVIGGSSAFGWGVSQIITGFLDNEIPFMGIKEAIIKFTSTPGLFQDELLGINTLGNMLLTGRTAPTDIGKINTVLQKSQLIYTSGSTIMDAIDGNNTNLSPCR